MWSAECKPWNVKCGVRSVECYVCRLRTTSSEHTLNPIYSPWRYYYRTILYYRYLYIYIHFIYTQLPRKPWSSWAPVQRCTNAAAWGNWSQRECMRCQRHLGGLGAEDTEDLTMKQRRHCFPRFLDGSGV